MTISTSWAYGPDGLTSPCGKFFLSEAIPHGTWLLHGVCPSDVPAPEFRSQMAAVFFGDLAARFPRASFEDLQEIQLNLTPIPRAELARRDNEFEQLRISHYGK